MKVTIDLQHLVLVAGALVSGAALHAFAAPPVHPLAPVAPVPPPTQRSMSVPPSPSAVTRWDFRCVSEKAAFIHGHEGLTAAHEVLDDWNVYIKQMTDTGWEPAIFLTTGGLNVSGVCFRRPQAPEKAKAPAPPRPPAQAQGRCTLSQVLELRESGMSESAIATACTP